MLLPLTGAAATASLSIKPISIQAGSEAELSVELTNIDTPLTLVQFDMQLPAGLTLKRNGGKYVCSMAERSPKHSFEVNEIDGKIRFLLHSANNDAISGNSGVIIQMTLAAASSFSSGSIVIDNTLLVSPTKQEFTIGKYSYNVKVDETPPSKWKDGDVFTSKTVEGVEMTFKVISASKKTCQVGNDKFSDRCINDDTEGTVTIPTTVEGLSVIKIKSNAFSGCSKLTNVFIPEGVITIESFAFDRCSYVEQIRVADNNKTYDSRQECNAIIHKASKTLVEGCKNSIIPDDVVKIGDMAFTGRLPLYDVFRDL